VSAKELRNVMLNNFGDNLKAHGIIERDWIRNVQINHFDNNSGQNIGEVRIETPYPRLVLVKTYLLASNGAIDATPLPHSPLTAYRKEYDGKFSALPAFNDIYELEPYFDSLSNPL
jgi:hypothetical protein